MKHEKDETERECMCSRSTLNLCSWSDCVWKKSANKLQNKKRSKRRKKKETREKREINIYNIHSYKFKKGLNTLLATNALKRWHHDVTRTFEIEQQQQHNGMYENDSGIKYKNFTKQSLELFFFLLSKLKNPSWSLGGSKVFFCPHFYVPLVFFSPVFDIHSYFVSIARLLNVTFCIWFWCDVFWIRWSLWGHTVEIHI